MRFGTTSTALIALTMVVALRSQSQRDFSGTWTVDSLSTVDAPQTMTVKQVLVRTNIRGEPIAPFYRQIVIAREGRTETYDIGVISGSVSGVVDGSSSLRRTHRSVVWEEQALVIENGSYTGAARETGDWTERRESWSFDATQRLRVQISTRGSGVPTVDTTWLYRRQ